MNARILIVDDDKKLRDLLDDYLINQGFLVQTLPDGQHLMATIEQFQPDLIILDIMMPGEDGLSLCHRVKSQKSIPVLMLTARGDDKDKLVGFDQGADDYLSKPFNPRELLARMKAILRRMENAATEAKEQATKFLCFSGWKLDLETFNLLDESGVITILSTGEFKLLRHLAEHANQILSRDQLMEVLAGHDICPTDRTIDVMISRLRKRLNDNAKEAGIIVTIRNLGYKLACSVSSE